MPSGADPAAASPDCPPRASLARRLARSLSLPASSPGLRLHRRQSQYMAHLDRRCDFVALSRRAGALSNPSRFRLPSARRLLISTSRPVFPTPASLQFSSTHPPLGTVWPFNPFVDRHLPSVLAPAPCILWRQSSPSPPLHSSAPSSPCISVCSRRCLSIDLVLLASCLPLRRQARRRRRGGEQRAC